MNSQGYRNVEEFVSNNINIDLAKELNKEFEINKFVIVDDTYGYNAISAVSYAMVDKYYVLFANKENILDIQKFLSEVNPEKIIIFGEVASRNDFNMFKHSWNS